MATYTSQHFLPYGTPNIDWQHTDQMHTARVVIREDESRFVVTADADQLRVIADVFATAADELDLRSTLQMAAGGDAA